MRFSQQRGAALITVLLMFAIITLLVSQLITRSQTDIERTSWLVNEAQAYQYALGGEALARQLLWQQQANLKKEGIPISPVPYTLPAYKPEFGQMAIEIIDLQGLVNLNNIAGDNAKKLPISRLFNDRLLRPELTQRLTDWVDTDTTPRPGGAEDVTYLAMELPYRAANLPVSHPSELVAMTVLTHDEYKTIAPYLSVLNKPTAINPNTASAEVLSLLHPSLSGEQIVNFREANPPGFLSVNELMTANITAGLPIDPTGLTVTSAHFGVKILVTINESSFWLFSRLTLDHSNGDIRLQGRTVGERFTLNTLDNNEGQDDTAATPLF